MDIVDALHDLKKKHDLDYGKDSDTTHEEAIKLIEHLRAALEIISQGYGVGMSADDYGDLAREALKQSENPPSTEPPVF